MSLLCLNSNIKKKQNLKNQTRDVSLLIIVSYFIDYSFI